MPAIKNQIPRQAKKPGPVPLDAPLEPERDLADSALILDLLKLGALKSHPNGTELKEFSSNTQQETKRLSQEEENRLAILVQEDGDVDARNALVLANIGLVHLVANQFFRPPLRYEDLVQEGTMGLIRATETFEPNRGVRFSTYSVYWIRAKIQRLIQNLEKDDVPTITGANSVVDASGRTRTPRARKLNLDKTLDFESDRTLGDTIASDIENPEVIALRSEKERLVKYVLEEIIAHSGDARMAEIVKRRLLADEPETLTQVGRRMHLSREGARLLESKMLRIARLRLQGLQNSSS